MSAKSGGIERGYPLEIIQDGSVNAKYQCGSCKLILRNPVQSMCGHRFCRQCVISAVENNSGAQVVCPLCQESNDIDDASYLKVEEINPDYGIKREISKLLVVCSNAGCSWKGVFKDFEVHYEKCEFRLVSCETCNQMIISTLLSAHMSDHSLGSGCPFQCSDEASGETTAEHLKRNAVGHLNIVHRRLTQLETDYNGSIETRNSGGRGDSNILRSIESLQEEMRKIKSEMGTVVMNSGSGGGIDGMNTSSKLNMYENVLSVLNTEVEKLYNQVESTGEQQNTDREDITQLEARVKALERQVAMKDAVIAELDLRISSLEQTNYNGELLWRINDVKARREDAVRGKTPSIYSSPFFTSKTGYKMCARLYLNGDGIGKGTHVSLFFVVMRGHFDALLPWPFKQKVTLMFLDQNNRDHVIDAFFPDPTSSSFKQPVTDMNIASGCPKLIPLANLDNPNRGYIKDDTAFIKIIVNLDGLK